MLNDKGLNQNTSVYTYTHSKLKQESCDQFVTRWVKMSSIFRNLGTHTNPRHFAKCYLSGLKKFSSINFEKEFYLSTSGLLSM